MTKISNLTFHQVRSQFLRDNSSTPERNNWPLGALQIADQQFRMWAHVILRPADVLTILLPQHNHEVNLVPAAGSTVAATVPRVSYINQASECFTRIRQFLGPSTPLIFLSAAPINHPAYPDYHGLIDRGCTGLTHLDGLHRMVAWGWENQRDVEAYVAGLP